MSIQAMEWAWQQDVAPLEKLVLLAIAWNCNGKTGACFPGANGIAERTGLQRRSLRRLIVELEKEKLLGRSPRYREDGGQTSNDYVLKIPPGHSDRGGHKNVRRGGSDGSSFGGTNSAHAKQS